jgi:hypothetical protein
MPEGSAWWPGTANNYWNIDDLVRAYARVREESRIVLPRHDWKLWELLRAGASPDGAERSARFGPRASG